MELQLGKRADYTVRAVLDLAGHHGQGRRTAGAIATARDIPASYLPQLLAQLARAGIVVSEPGRAGGYTLARDPSELALLEVIEVVDGELRSGDCVLRPGPCRPSEPCAMHRPWERAQDGLRDALARTSFAELVDAERAG